MQCLKLIRVGSSGMGIPCKLKRGHLGKCRSLHLKNEIRIALPLIDPDVLVHASGRVSSKMPPFHLIPRASLVALANRFGRGARIKKEAAWNTSLTPEQHKLTMEDKAFVIERLGHAIDHALKAIARLQGHLPLLDEEEANDGGDAGAIMFAGALLACRDEYERGNKQ